MRRAFLAALVLLAGAAMANAHSRSETTVPANGATVEAVPELAIIFDKPMRITVFKLTSGGDELTVTRETGLEPVTDFRAAPAEPLAPGAYEIEWRGLSGDGHPMQGAYRFTVSE